MRMGLARALEVVARKNPQPSEGHLADAAVRNNERGKQSLLPLLASLLAVVVVMTLIMFVFACVDVLCVRVVIWLRVCVCTRAWGGGACGLRAGVVVDLTEGQRAVQLALWAHGGEK